MADRGIAVAHTTIMRWVIRYVPELEKRWNRFARPVGRSWRVDETYISVRGRWRYMYRAVDKQGKTVDFLLRPDRGIAAAQAFFRKALASHPRGPRKVTLGNREHRLNALRFLSFVVLAHPALPAHARDGVGLPMPNAIAIHAEPSAPHPTRPAPVNAEFRGCESAGWCRFWIESLDRMSEATHRVYPDGVARMPAGNATSIAVRDRLNTLLSSMIHQSKRVVLHDLRDLGDGTFAATVTVNEANLASDPDLMELQGKAVSTTR